jgi:hypothetical protein
LGSEALIDILKATMTRNTVMSSPSRSATSDGWRAKAENDMAQMTVEVKKWSQR